jgi:hypothetical protein
MISTLKSISLFDQAMPQTIPSSLVFACLFAAILARVSLERLLLFSGAAQLLAFLSGLLVPALFIIFHNVFAPPFFLFLLVL